MSISRTRGFGGLEVFLRCREVVCCMLKLVLLRTVCGAGSVDSVIADSTADTVTPVGALVAAVVSVVRR